MSRKVNRTKTHWCDICKTYYHWLGIARHRTMHYEQRRRGEQPHPKNKKNDIIKRTKTE